MKCVTLFIAAVMAAGCTSTVEGGEEMRGPPHLMKDAGVTSNSARSAGGSMMEMKMMMSMSDLGPLAGCARDADPVATRLSRLHDELKIVAAQETPWRAFAAAYEGHAAMAAMDMSPDKSESTTAPDRMRHEEAIMEADLSTLRVLRASLEALYLSLDPSQRSAADVLKCTMPMGHK